MNADIESNQRRSTRLGKRQEKRPRDGSPELVAVPGVQPELVSIVAPPPQDKSLAGVVREAHRLRSLDPAKYGAKGSREGSADYVRNGWQQALKDAAASLGCCSAEGEKKQKKNDRTPLQRQAQKEYLQQVRLLQVKYFPLMGRPLSRRASRTAASSSDSLSSVRSG